MIKLPTLRDREGVKGKVIVNIGTAKKFEHKGIKLELSGLIEGGSKKENINFITLTKDLTSAGVLNKDITNYEFDFGAVQMQYETYKGALRKVRYLLKVTIDTKLRSHTYEQEFAVTNPENESVIKDNNKPIKLEVGIEEWLHLVFDLDKSHFGLKDVANGRVTFKKVSIKLKTMELQIIKQETVVGPQKSEPHKTVIIKYEIMDGGPIGHEVIPIRFFLKPYDLTPTMKMVANKFSVEYFASIVLCDIEDRKYFKQSEIFLHRIEKSKDFSYSDNIEKPLGPAEENKESEGNPEENKNQES